MANEVVETLRKARELISDRKRWTKRVLARNQSRSRVQHYSSLEACRWCATGAVLKVNPDVVTANAALSILGEDMEDCIGDFNDYHNHAEVLAAFDAAIEKAGAND
jgi:hypothetical protein